MVRLRWKTQISNSLHPVNRCGNCRIHAITLRPHGAPVNGGGETGISGLPISCNGLFFNPKGIVSLSPALARFREGLRWVATRGGSNPERVVYKRLAQANWSRFQFSHRSCRTAFFRIFPLTFRAYILIFPA